MKLFSKRKKASGVVGVAVSSEKLAIAHLQDEGGKPVIQVCESVPIAGSKDVGELLARRVKALNLSGLKCNFTLSRRDYALHQIEAPSVEPQEMRAAVRWKIKDLLDMKVDDAAVDVFPVPEDAYRSRVKMVYVVAAAKKRIRSIASMVVDSGLELAAIDIPELVMRNISNQFMQDDNGLGFMDLRKTGSTLNLTRGGQLYLTRRINTQVAPDIMTSPDWDSLRDRLVLEIQRSLDYFESQMGQPQITQIMLAPRATDGKAMAEALNAQLTVHVSPFDLKQYLKSKVDLTAELQQSCLAAIGATLRNRPVPGRTAEVQAA
ncbi:MAG: hypothetical protein RLZZ385_2563 [Pseudomonadota bacterium]|jgi:MSHA biogenesis protein MshI